MIRMQTVWSIYLYLLSMIRTANKSFWILCLGSKQKWSGPWGSLQKLFREIEEGRQGRRVGLKGMRGGSKARRTGKWG